MQRLGAFFSRIARGYLPDAMVLACLLTLAVMLCALIFPQTPDLADTGLARRALSLTGMWLAALWNPAFLTFALQMCVVLLTGFGLARAPLVMRGLQGISRRVHTSRGAVTVIALISCAGCWINWGLGLIVAGVLATELRRELDRKGVRCQFALIVAAAYAGMMIWHGGLSGSAPLKVAADGVAITTPDGAAATADPISIAATVLHPANVMLTIALLVAIPLIFRAMAGHGDGGDAPTPPKPASPTDSPTLPVTTPAERVNRSRLIPLAIAALVFVALTLQLRQRGVGAIGLNFVNSAFLALGLALHRDLPSYMQAVAAGGRAVVGIVIQFPLYSGIQGVMFGAGLAAAISQGFVQASEAVAAVLPLTAQQTFPLATLTSAAVVNFFVPSGGGQWIVQGPIMCTAARTLDVPLGQTVMAIAYGDQLTNMIQPFWAIPLMGMTGVNVRAFLGYCALLMLLAAPVFAAALLLY